MAPLIGGNIGSRSLIGIDLPTPIGEGDYPGLTIPSKSMMFGPSLSSIGPNHSPLLYELYTFLGTSYLKLTGYGCTFFIDFPYIMLAEEAVISRSEK